MRYLSISWDRDDDPDGNVQHIADNDLSRYIVVFYDEIDEFTIRPVTAYEVEEP